MASFAFAKYSLSGYVLMSVCMFRRPTSCRPCLMSSIALSSRILSGWALLSTPVDLLTFFFRCRSCASLDVALNKNSAPRTQSAIPLPAVPTFDVAEFTVRPKRHLSRLSCFTLLTAPPTENQPAPIQHPICFLSTGSTKYTLNQRPGGARTLPFRTVPSPGNFTLCEARFHPTGCLAGRQHFYYFQRNVTMFRFGMATIRLPSSFPGVAATRAFA